MYIACPACAHPNDPHANVCAGCATPLLPAGEKDTPAPTDEQVGFSIMDTMSPYPSGDALYSLEDIDPMLGQQVGNFLLLEKIGEGGYGVVYRAEHLHLKQSFAVKLLHTNQRVSQEQLERFRREALAISKLRHTRVVQLSEFGLLPQGKGFYLAMELLQGQSLAARLQQGQPLPIAHTVAIVEQLCEVLHEAHSIGIYHRDIKPGNVFLLTSERSTEVRLLDFGIASMGAEEGAQLTQSNAIMGSPAYMSPEQIQGQQAPDKSSGDLYSLGVVLYQMLTGRLPFEADNVTALLFKHAFTPPPPLREAAPAQLWSQSLEDFIQRALAKAPGDRPPDAQAFKRECVDALRAPATAYRQDSRRIASPTTPQEPGKRRWKALIAAVVVFSLAGGLWLWQGPTTQHKAASPTTPHTQRPHPRPTAALRRPNAPSSATRRQPLRKRHIAAVVRPQPPATSGRNGETTRDHVRAPRRQLRPRPEPPRRPKKRRPPAQRQSPPYRVIARAAPRPTRRRAQRAPKRRPAPRADARLQRLREDARQGRVGALLKALHSPSAPFRALAVALLGRQKTSLNEIFQALMRLVSSESDERVIRSIARALTRLGQIDSAGAKQLTPILSGQFAHLTNKTKRVIARMHLRLNDFSMPSVMALCFSLNDPSDSMAKLAARVMGQLCQRHPGPKHFLARTTGRRLLRQILTQNKPRRLVRQQIAKILPCYLKK